MSESAKAIPKPQLRNLYLKKIKFNLVGMVICTSSILLAYKILHIDVQKKHVEQYFRNYDLVKPLERMNAAGLMQSCPLDEVDDLKKSMGSKYAF